MVTLEKIIKSLAKKINKELDVPVYVNGKKLKKKKPKT